MRSARRLTLPFARRFGLTIALLAVAACRKKAPPVAVPFDAAPLPESPADLDAKDVIGVVLDTYPSLCEADAAARSWPTCRDTVSSYIALHACAEKAHREARRALDALRPSTQQHGECGEQVRKAAILFLNTAPKFFGDLLSWMQDRHAKLAPEMVGKSLADACRATPSLCQGEPHDWDDAYKAMHMRSVEKIDCTAHIFTCGRSETADCSLASVAPRLGVACQASDNRRGTSPEDLLYVRGSGTPIAR